MPIRPATPADFEAVAALHAASWSVAYRNILSNAYLDGPVLQDRLDLWRKRRDMPETGQYVALSEENGELTGFVCVLAFDDPEWGALVDNLHVRPDMKGGGRGALLLGEAARWVRRTYPEIAMLHLWVFAANEAACRFYDRMGGEPAERAMVDSPGGGIAECIRYVWRDLDVLIRP